MLQSRSHEYGLLFGGCWRWMGPSRDRGAKLDCFLMGMGGDERFALVFSDPTYWLRGGGL